MTHGADALPDDPETLKAMLIAERIRSERLVQILKDMQRHRFGRRAETLSADQLLLALEDVEQSEAETAAEAEAKSQATRAEGSRKRRALPPHLPRIESIVDVESKACPCCGGELHRIGEDVSEKSSTSSPPSSGFSSCGGPNTPAAPVRTLWSKPQRRRG